MKRRSDLPPVPYSVSGAADAHPARRIARLVEDVGQRRARMTTSSLVVVAALSGALVALGWALATLALADPSLGPLAARLLAGAAIATGVAIALLSGGELFAANLLLPMAWVSGHVGGAALRRHWAAVFVGNFLGAAFAVFAVETAGLLALAEGQAETARGLGAEVAELGYGEAFWRGALGALLLSAAVWLTYASASLTDRLLALLPPVALLAALGCEIAPLTMAAISAGPAPIPWGPLAAVALGNLAVGGLGAAAVYWWVYRRGRHEDDEAGPGA